MMDPVSNADRLILLLRQKLQERARAAATGRGPDAARQPTGAIANPQGVRALAAVEGSDERALRRAVIQHLLADQFGSALLNDAQFQQVISRVTDTIEEDTDAAALLSRLVSTLRA